MSTYFTFYSIAKISTFHETNLSKSLIHLLVSIEFDNHEMIYELLCERFH